MKRNIWRERYMQNGFPPFPCPRCKSGVLRTIKDTLRKEYEPSREEGRESEKGRFSVLLRCSLTWCGEVVAVAGNVVPGWDYDQEGEQVYFDYFYPKALVSCVPVISIAAKTPSEIAEPIRSSFSLLWADRGAAANKLRISVELILDHYAVPRKSRKNGRWLSLDGRIKEFEKLDIGHHETLDALRVVGNRGSHEGSIDFDTMLDSYEVFEDALLDLFDGRALRLAAIRKRLRESKGREASKNPV